MKKPHKDYFIFEIEKLECHLAHVQILEGRIQSNNKRGNEITSEIWKH